MRSEERVRGLSLSLPGDLLGLCFRFWLPPGVLLEDCERPLLLAPPGALLPELFDFRLDDLLLWERARLGAALLCVLFAGSKCRYLQVLESLAFSGLPCSAYLRVVPRAILAFTAPILQVEFAHSGIFLLAIGRPSGLVGEGGATGSSFPFAFTFTSSVAGRSVGASAAS